MATVRGVWTIPSPQFGWSGPSHVCSCWRLCALLPRPHKCCHEMGCSRRDCGLERGQTDNAYSSAVLIVQSNLVNLNLRVIQTNMQVPSYASLWEETPGISNFVLFKQFLVPLEYELTRFDCSRLAPR
uniref:Putative tetraspanin n=1 Tax=Ixodes ricinus TaxID=34613 RepID=A0A0K8R4J5_IXORI